MRAHTGLVALDAWTGLAGWQSGQPLWRFLGLVGPHPLKPAALPLSCFPFVMGLDEC